MQHRNRTPARWAAALAVLALLAAGVGAAPPGPGGSPSGPIAADGRWSDELDDTNGLSWLEGTHQAESQVTLSQFEALGEQELGEIWAMTEGPPAGGKFYLGADNAHLWSYDLASGEAQDLGAPVPDECDT